MNDQNNAAQAGPNPNAELPPPLPSRTLHTPRVAAESRPVAPDARPAFDPLPDGIKGWSWGGFLLNWIWAIRFRVWWGLLALIPWVGFGVMVWLGLKGREMAWRNSQWNSRAEFNQAQRKWSIAGGIVTLVAVLGLAGWTAYQHRLATADEVAGPGRMTQEQMAAIISSPVTIRTAPAPEPVVAVQPEPYSILPDPAPSTIAVAVLGKSGRFNIFDIQPKDDLDALKYFSGNTVYQPQELVKLLPVIETETAAHYGLTCEYLCADAQGNVVGRTRVYIDDHPGQWAPPTR